MSDHVTGASPALTPDRPAIRVGRGWSANRDVVAAILAPAS
jgi:hypothetical protein